MRLAQTGIKPSRSRIPTTSNSGLIGSPGLGRAEDSNPRFPGLAYYCDVSAFHRSNPNAYFWTELLTANADLNHMRAEVRETGFELREWRNGLSAKRSRFK